MSHVYKYKTHIHLYVIYIGFGLRSKESIDVIKSLITEYKHIYEEHELISCPNIQSEQQLLNIMQSTTSSIIDVNKISVNDIHVVIGVWHNNIRSLMARVLEFKNYMKFADSLS